MSKEQILIEHIESLSQIGTWELDLTNQQLHWSDGVFRMLGYAPRSFEVTFENGLSTVHPDDRARALAHMQEVLAKDIPYLIEKRLLAHDGSIRHVRSKATAYRNENGQATQLIGVFQDITDFVQAQQALKQQEAYLNTIIDSAPVRMIDSFLTLLNRRYGPQLDSKAQQYIHFAVDGARRMRQVILALLDFSRVTQYEKHLSTCNLSELVAESLQLQRKLIRDKQAQVHCGSLPTLKTYRAPLQQVFLNLLENALKYSAPERPPQIEIGAEEHPHEWVLSIKDNGIGIAPEFFDKIFILFQRLHAKHEYSGTGIGLAIVKKVVESLGGRIWLNSQPGEGSCFYFTISKNPEQLAPHLSGQSSLSV